jgi:phosphatidylethanolamine-binding protein (PEBP) family uncharacterized protein
MKLLFAGKEISDNSHFNFSELNALMELQPEILYSFDPKKLYTIIITDENSKPQNFLHLLLINRSNIVKSYYPPYPPKGTGDHKYIVAIYEQPNKIEDMSMTYLARIGFNLNSFVNKYQLKLVDSTSFIINN